jgi:hypothetical protein
LEPSLRRDPGTGAGEGLYEGSGHFFHPLLWTLHRLPWEIPWDRARVMGPLLEAP